MAPKLIALCNCQNESTEVCIGGQAHAIEVNEEMIFNSFIDHVATIFCLDKSILSLKYYFPGKRYVLVSMKNDADLKNFVKIFNDSIWA